jgi:protease-4
MEFVGLGAELTFFKNTLDKLGVSVHVIRGYDNHFKSAVEPFFLEKMSDSSRLQVQRYMTSLWEDVREDIAKDRKISAAKLNQIADNLSIKRAQDALSYKLVDGIKYKDEVLALIRQKIGLKGDNVLEFTKFEKYAQRKFKDQQTLNRINNPNIAVVVAEGDIAVDGAGISSTKLCRTLRELRAKKGIKAAVIRINSPGGSALASDEIWREITLLKQKMKVIVSMGDVAASGGYYIATPADFIFAEETTITGSIGVFGVIPYTGKFMEDKLGLSFDRISTNKHAVLSTNRPLTAEELDMMQTEVNAIYDDFIKRVSEGRKLSKKQVHTIARGRVWTGKDAHKIGLVDGIGGIEEAIQYAKKLTGISSAKVMYLPKVKEDPFQPILDILEEEDREELNISNTKIPLEFKTYLNEFLLVKSMKGIQMRLPYSLKIN